MNPLTQWAKERERQICEEFELARPILKPEGPQKPKDWRASMWQHLKLKELAEPYRERFRDFLREADERASDHNEQIMAWDARRSLIRQLWLYRQGRTRAGQKVTWTIASNHIFGGALDVVLWGPSWKLPRWWKTTILPLAEKHGLESLYLTRGKDVPHIQIPEADWPIEVEEWRRDLKREFRSLWRKYA